MLKVTYSKRSKGGYYAAIEDPDVLCTVERVYTFTMPTSQWVARHQEAVVFGDSRKEAVEILVRSIRKKG